MGTKSGTEKDYSVSALARMMGVDRRTLASRLADATPLKSSAREKLYRLSDAVQGFISQPLQGQEVAVLTESRARKLEAEAGLAELKLRRESAEVVSVNEVRDYTMRLFKSLHNRIGVRFPREISAQLYKAESPAHVTEVLQKELGRIFQELRQDHQRFLQEDKPEETDSREGTKL